MENYFARDVYSIFLFITFILTSKKLTCLAQGACCGILWYRLFINVISVCSSCIHDYSELSELFVCLNFQSHQQYHICLKYFLSKYVFYILLLDMYPGWPKHWDIYSEWWVHCAIFLEYAGSLDICGPGHNSEWHKLLWHHCWSGALVYHNNILLWRWWLSAGQCTFSLSLIVFILVWGTSIRV